MKIKMNDGSWENSIKNVNCSDSLSLSDVCLIEKFFEEQRKLPLAKRGICMLVCRCKKCTEKRGTL